MAAHSQRTQGAPHGRTMFLILACLVAAATAAPSYDQRQEGERNVATDFQNVVIVVGIPKKVHEFITSFFKMDSKRSGDDSLPMDRSDMHVMKAFEEPNTPYQVEIGSEHEGSAKAQESDAEVLIAGRRRLETEPQSREEEMKLIGATEQCGPDRERDPVTLTCRFRKEDKPEKIPEVVPVLT